MWINTFKTFVLLLTLTLILVFIGDYFGGASGALMGLIAAAVMNFASWFFSDKIAVSSVRAREVSRAEAPDLHALVEEVVESAGVPKPRIYVAPIAQPNAFATGRDPKHAAVVFTEGILRLLNRRELKGVIAHEIAHVKNRDILIMSVVATIAGAIMFLVNMLRWGAMFGMGGRDRDRGNPLVLLAMIIVLPIVVTIIKLAISRAREYLADYWGAKFIKDPEALASALQKLAYGVKKAPAEVPQYMSHMFIVNPFSGGFLAELFSTHPPIEKRIERLMKLANDPEFHLS
ncbi:MAG: zinc metalloprotease HtpX [Thermotogae bacterium]|nr:zinc metalloprotease HtpX [Thermotogota bacterium]